MLTVMMMMMMKKKMTSMLSDRDQSRSSYSLGTLLLAPMC